MKLNTATEILFKEYAGYVEMMHSVGCSEKVRDWILHKMRHTYAVLHSVQTIISNDPVLVRLSREDKEVIESAALLHDIGRFSQHDGENILSNAEHPHGDVGYRMLSERGVTHPAVLLGVKTHDKF